MVVYRNGVLYQQEFLRGLNSAPGYFVMMIKDLSVAKTNIWKYVDDTTLAECVEKNGTSSMQSRVDEFVTKSRADGFQQGT